MPTPPFIKKRRWNPKTSEPPETTKGAVVYDAEGNVIVRENLLAPHPKQFKNPRTRPMTSKALDIPTIVESYISLVGKVITDMNRRADKGLQAHEVNSVAAIGRAVAMLQAVESASITRVGGKAVKEHTSEQLRALLARSEAAEVANTADPSEEA